MTRIRFFAVLAVIALFGATMSLPAVAGRKSGHGDGRVSATNHGAGHGKKHGHLDKTKLQFELDSHSWDTDAEVIGHATLWTRSGHEWVALSGATVTIWVDGQESGYAVTDSEGHTIVTWGPAEDGGHSFKLRYAGDATHKGTKRAQGFHVGAADETLETVEIPAPEATDL